MQSLPHNIIYKISSHLPTHDIGQLSLVSKYMGAATSYALGIEKQKAIDAVYKLVNVVDLFNFHLRYAGIEIHTIQCNNDKHVYMSWNNANKLHWLTRVLSHPPLSTTCWKITVKNIPGFLVRTSSLATPTYEFELIITCIAHRACNFHLKANTPPWVSQYKYIISNTNCIYGIFMLPAQIFADIIPYSQIWDIIRPETTFQTR